MKMICYGYLNFNLLDAQDSLFVSERCITKVSTCTSGTENHPRPKVSTLGKSH